MAKQSGFTLIELVLVIVILGILAAAALPRFSDLSTQARVASVNGLAGSVRSAAAIAHATQLARGISSVAAGVNIDGGVVDFAAGYPTAATINQMMSDTTGFTFAGGIFTLTAGCTVTYNASVGGAFPVIAVASGGC